MLCPETSSNSLFHRLASRGDGCQRPRLVSVYLLVVAVTYLPVLIAASLGSLPLWEEWAQGPLNFFEDWGFNYAVLVSLPSLVVLLVSDEYVLSTSLEEVHQDEVLVLREGSESLMQTWKGYFRITNLIAQVGAIVLGIVFAMVTFGLNVKLNNVTSWIAPDRLLHLTGYMYLYCISLFYAVIIFYVTRCILISLFLRALVQHAELQILPLHPDKCGGLRPVGQLGLRNQYTLTILGINLVLLLIVWVYCLKGAAPFREIMLAGSAVYLLLGPVIFMAPLLPFRAGMEREKRKWNHEFAQALRVEIDLLREQITTNQVSKVDEKSIERLREVGSAINELPIWPFDPSTLRKFGTAYVVPIALPLLQGVFALLKKIE